MKKCLALVIILITLLSCSSNDKIVNSNTDDIKVIKFVINNTTLPSDQIIFIYPNHVETTYKYYSIKDSTIKEKDSSFSLTKAEWDELTNSITLTDFYNLDFTYAYPDSIKPEDLASYSIRITTNARDKEVTYYSTKNVKDIDSIHIKLLNLVYRFEWIWE